jgi:dihydropteroate synthase
VPPSASADALLLAGGPLLVGGVELLWRSVHAPADVHAWSGPLDALRDWARGEGDHITRWLHGRLDALSQPRPSFGGVALDAPRLMGVVNATPDSFSDGGQFRDVAEAAAFAERLAAEGADIIDVGGESTRPDSAGVSTEEELARAIPVVEKAARLGLTVSIDTRKAKVMAAALDAGAKIVNDTSALGADSCSVSLAAKRRCPVVLMHMRGAPADMRHHAAYDSAPLDVYDELEGRVAACRAAGIEWIAVDPGLGFAKTSRHNAEIMAALPLFHGLGCPLVVGASRKGLVRTVRTSSAPSERLGASLAAAVVALDAGVQILRVHDVAEHVQALAVWQAVRLGEGG